MRASWDWPGSRWWRVDLHAHSPESYDFKLKKGEKKDDQCWIRWIKAVRKYDIDAIAITDHNTAGAVSLLQAAIKKVEDPPVLFPGVELTASDGTHLLLLLDPSCKQQDVDKQLSKLSVTSRGQSESRSTHSIEDIFKKCGHEVLVIGAHVNGPKGLLRLTGQQRIAVLRHTNLAAVEVDPEKKLEAGWLDGSCSQIERTISQIWASDGHSYCKLGQRFTWAKMTRPDLEGLRLALLDGSDSLKPAYKNDPDNHKKNLADPNAHASLAIESVRIKEGKFIGKPHPFKIEFNPWLNSIIGGRGTGKSTLVDFMRKTLRRDRELGDTEKSSLRRQFDRRMRFSSSRQEEGLLTEDTCIEVIYRKGGERFVLSWSNKGKVDPIARLHNNERVREEGNVPERFPVRIYSQKQLFALAQNPKALLTVIDDSSTVQRGELNRSIGKTQSDYLSLCTQIRSVHKQLNELAVRQANLSDIRRKLGVIHKGKHAQALHQYKIYRQLDNNWQVILNEAVKAIDSVNQSTAELLVADLDFIVDTKDGRVFSKDLKLMHKTLTKIVTKLQDGVTTSVENAHQGINDLQKGPVARQWREALQEGRAQSQKATAELNKYGLSDLNEYDKLIEKANDISNEIRGLEKEKARLGDLKQEARSQLDRYRDYLS